MSFEDEESDSLAGDEVGYYEDESYSEEESNSEKLARKRRDEEYENDEREKKSEEERENMKKELEKLKAHRNSFCEYCGIKLPESDWGRGKCKNPKCKVNNSYIRINT